MGRILAIDYGRRRVGLAVTDPLRIIASPLETVAANELLEYLEKYFDQNTVDMVVIGMPLQMNGQPSDSQRYIRPFMGRFHARFPQMEMREADERFTSVLAERAMVEAGLSKAKRRDKAMVDKTAASLILQGFLDTLRQL